MKISIIIPAYNEGKRIPATLKIIDEYLRKQNYEYEIMVVCDGAKDNTAEAVNLLIPQIPNLRLIDRKENRGKGYTIKEGMLSATGDYRVFTDADNSTSIDHLEKFIPEFEAGYEVTIGTRDSRDHKDAKQAVPQPFYRRILGDIFNIFTQFVLGFWGTWDTQCGFKGFSAEAAKNIFSKTTIDRFAFDAEALVIARRLKYRIKKIPVYWINEAASTVKFKDMVKMATDLLKIRLNDILGKYKV